MWDDIQHTDALRQVFAGLKLGRLVLVAGDSVTFVCSSATKHEFRGRVGAITVHNFAIHLVYYPFDGHSNNDESGWKEKRLDDFTGFYFRSSINGEGLSDIDKAKVNSIFL